MDNKYSYYQNLYNMFGGYNPLLDSKVKKLRRLGVTIGCGMVCFTLMQYAVAALLRLFGLASLYQSDAIVQTGVGAIGQIIYVFLPFALVFSLYDREDRNSVDIFELPKSKELFVFSVFTGLMICSLGDRATSFASVFIEAAGVSFEQPEGLDVNTPLGYALQIVSYSVVPALVEEFAMRGVVMQPLRKYGDRFAIVTSAVLFAALHGNMVQIPFAFIAGLSLGYFAVVTNSIWTSVAIHFLNNFSATVVSIYCSNHSESGALCFYLVEGAILVLGIIALIFFVRLKPKKLAKSTDEIDNSLKYSTVFCTPSIVISFLISLFSLLRYTRITSAGGVLVAVAMVALIAFLLIKGSMNAKRDTRITKSSMYSFSIALTAVAAFFIMFFVMVLPLSNR